MTRNFGCRVSDAYSFMKSRLLVMENDKLRISILLDKGSDIIEFLHKPTDTDFIWRSPLKHADMYKYIQSIPNHIDFRDYYLGGWQEMFPVGADGFALTGARIGNHGELWGLPWNCSIIEDTANEVKVKLWTHTIRTPFYVEKTLTLKSKESALSIHETIANLGQVDLGVMWGHHPAFGEAFLDEHCAVFAPAKSMIDPAKNRYSWPIHDGQDYSRVLPKNSDQWNMYYLNDLSEGWYALINQKKRIGFGLVWDKDIFKYLWFWGCYNYKNISPWYGRAYTIALEPFTSLPYPVDPETLFTIPAGKSISTEFKAIVIAGKTSIQGISAEGEVR